MFSYNNNADTPETGTIIYFINCHHFRVKVIQQQCVLSCVFFLFMCDRRQFLFTNCNVRMTSQPSTTPLYPRIVDGDSVYIILFQWSLRNQRLRHALLSGILSGHSAPYCILYHDDWPTVSQTTFSIMMTGPQSVKLHLVSCWLARSESNYILYHGDWPTMHHTTFCILLTDHRFHQSHNVRHCKRKPLMD